MGHPRAPFFRASSAAATLTSALLSVTGCAGTPNAGPGLTTLAEVCSDQPHRRLVWFQRFFADGRYNRTPVALALHVRDDTAELPTYTLTAYAVTPEGLRPDARVELGGPHWSVPVLLPDRAQTTFVLFETVDAGSASYHQYALLFLGEERAREIPIEPPTTALADQIGPRQHSDPGRTWIGVDPARGPGLWFEFSIWNPGESNNFPTGGRITGRLEVRRGDDGNPVRLVVGAWERRP